MKSTAASFPCGAARTSVGHAEALQHRPASRVQTIAADFFPRESRALQDERAQAGLRAKGRAARARRTAPHDGDIPHFRLASRCGRHEPPLHQYSPLPRAAVERKARPEQESARGAAQAGRVSDARPLRPRHLRRQSARPAQAGRLLFHALENGGGRSENARAARGGLGFRDAHRGERSRVAPARGQADQGIPAALQHLLPRRQTLPRRESRSDGRMAAFSSGAFQEG